MSIVGRVGTVFGTAEMLTSTGERSSPWWAPPTTKRAVVVAVSMLTLAALLAALIPASEVPNNAEHYSSSARATHDRSGAAVSQPAAPQMSEREALDAYSKLSLSFVPNEGQTNEAVRYYTQGAGYGFFFTKEGATLSFADDEGGGYALGLDFLGADPHATLKAQKRLSGEVNYLGTDDPSSWHRGLPTHGELLYGGLWPGIDMAVRGQGGNLKYEFHLKPGASVEDVRLAYRGAEGLSVGAGGELLVRTPLGVLKDAAPVSYQLIGGERVPVKSRYTLAGDGGYGFAVETYDPRYPLVIDPGLDYSTFLGGTSFDETSDIAIQDGNAYVTGRTFSADYPTTAGAFGTTFNGGLGDAFVTKLNASGSALVYSTFLGGTNDDNGEGIAVDGSGMAYVTGRTYSSDYPTTAGAFDTTYNEGEAFVTKLNASGSAPVYSTFLGGNSSDQGLGIAVDGSGMAYVTGDTSSADYPTTPGAFDTTYSGSLDAFVTKLNASGSALAYSTFLGRAKSDSGEGIAVDTRNRAYVTGNTFSTHYPTTAGAFDTTYSGGVRDAFVTKLNATGSAPVYSTLLGGTGEDRTSDIAVDTSNRAYVTGETTSADYPTTAGAFDTSFNGGFSDAFVTKLNASGSAPVYSTFLGGTAVDQGLGIAVDGSGMAYVTGYTESAGYPTTAGAFDTSYSNGDAFVTKLNALGSALIYSTFLGGTAVDRGEGIVVDGSGMAYVTGGTVSSTSYPTTAGAFDTTFNSGSQEAFVTKLPTS